MEFATPTKFFYVYNYTDHLGNVRLSYTQNGNTVKTLEDNHYYPFGLKHENYASERFERIREPNGDLYVIQPTERREWQYKFQEQERQDELGLNFYDYGARNYDAAIGRWMNIDTLAGKWQEYSPYCYTLNNPIFFVDPNGMDVYLYYYVRSKNKEDNSMFVNSAITRASEMLANMNEGDVYKISFVEDLGNLEEMVESDVKFLSPKYGGTRVRNLFSCGYRRSDRK